VVLCKSVMQVGGILGIAPSGVCWCKSALGAEWEETVRRFDLWFTHGSGRVVVGTGEREDCEVVRCGW
jgi:hypothetical protein